VVWRSVGPLGDAGFAGSDDCRWSIFGAQLREYG
jgi:hypothetical protein